jgi:hypothetical protein
MLAGLNDPGWRMNVGKTLFAQVMEFVPWKSFGRVVERHNGDADVRTLGCADLFRVMAFAQLTWRESLGDIEACLAANQGKLFHIGLKVPPARSTLSDALNQRDRRIYHALALRLIARARTLYAHEPSVLELDASVYALDATTIDLCLSLFDWAPFRSTKPQSGHQAAHAAGPARRDPCVHPHQRRQAARRERAGHPARGGRGVLRDGSAICGLRSPVQDASGRRLLRHPCQEGHGCTARLLGSPGSRQWRDLRSAHRVQRLVRGQELSGTSATHSLQATPSWARRSCS